MSVISRATLPENFYDITSPMLLVTPRPQNLYAQLFMAAMAGEAALQTGEPSVIPGRTLPSAGASYAGVDEGRLQQAEALRGEIFVPKVDFSGQPGDVVRFNRPVFASTTYTRASRRVVSNQTITTVPIGISSEQVALTLERFAGPYDSANSRVAPYGIDRFFTTHGVHSLPKAVGTHLANDYHDFIEYNVRALLDEAAVVVRPVGMTDDDTATASEQFPMDLETLFRAEQEADDRNLPTFGDGYRLLVLTPGQLKQLREDSDYVRSSESHPAYNVLFPQYVASVGKTHIFKSTTLDQSDNTNGIPIHKGHLICPGALLGGMGEMPRVMPSTDDNYGETAKMIWLSYMALGLADDRFVISVRTTGKDV